MNTLALDLGTNTGFCFADTRKGLSQSVGTWCLAAKGETTEQAKTGGERTGDFRYKRLYEHIHETVVEGAVRRIVFEDVLFASSQAQAQLWSSFRTAIWQMNVNIPGLIVQCVPVQTLKIFATGNGAAQKEDMAEALYTSPELTQRERDYLLKLKLDDNAVDAVWLWLYARNMDTTGASWSSVWEKRKARKKAASIKKKAKLAKKKAALDPFSGS